MLITIPYDELGLISKEKQNELEIIQKDIEDSFKSLQMFRSEFLMRSSVLGMHPTVDGKFWQSKLERSVHWWELVRVSYDWKLKNAEIELKRAQMEQKIYEHDTIKNKDKYAAAIYKAEANKIEIEIERDSIFLVHIKKEVEQRIREILSWTKIIAELRPQLKYSESNAEEYQPEEYAKLYAEKLQIMEQTKGSNSDFNGVLNTITVAKGIFSHSDVKKLIDKENRNKIELQNK